MTLKKALISAPTGELFNVYLPIKKVKITNEHRIIAAEGIFDGQPIGFSIEIPLNAEEIFDKNTLTLQPNIEMEDSKEIINGKVTTKSPS